MQRLTVLYDEGCPLCVRCAAWMIEQPAHLAIEVLPAGSQEARARYGAVPWLGGELVAVSDEGDVWAGAAAFLMCLWALEDWREWSYRLSGPVLAPLAARFFAALSHRRRLLGAWVRPCSGDRCTPRRATTPYR